jgi:ethanolamine transporter EutH
MKVAIFKSIGFVGKILIHKAVAASCQVKTLARNIFTTQWIIYLDVNGK